MNATDLIKEQLESSKLLTAALLADMQDAPLTSPTPQGGNHPLWIAGHLVYSEARITNEMMFDKPGPLLDWKDDFRGGSQPVADASQYRITIPEALATWDEIRTSTLTILAGLSDDDLDQPVAKCPPGREALFGTLGRAFTMVINHPLMHRGQIADARRAIDRKPLMAWNYNMPMQRVGISFRSTLTPDEVSERYVKPLRAALERDAAGIFSNYLRQVDPDAVEPTEHLLVFEVNEFKVGLRCLRVEAEKLDMPEKMLFQNLNPSRPGY
jgi:hypothetical protein